MDFTICVLAYGAHSELARRCLGSIRASLDLDEGAGSIQDVRLGLNTVSSETEHFVRAWATRLAGDFGIPSRLYHSPVSRLKYPLMRRMFHAPVTPAQELAPLLTWFDDDSYLAPRVGGRWWRALREALAHHHMVGQAWSMRAPESRWHWIARQPWFDPEVGIAPREADGARRITFCQGGWWAIRRDVLTRYDWPIPALRHNGGDSLLGELCRQQRLSVGPILANTVHINAGNDGGDSTAPRRGVTELDLGVLPPSDSLEHHDFPCEVELVCA